MIYAIIIYESIFCLQIVYAIGENTAIKTSYAFLGGWTVCVERDTGKKNECVRDGERLKVWDWMVWEQKQKNMR